MTTVETVAGQVKTGSSGQRYWEVDAVRGVAIVMMVIFHFLWDLWVFGVLPNIVLYDGFWKYFQRTTATLFIILVGVSLTISYHRALMARGPHGPLLEVPPPRPHDLRPRHGNHARAVGAERYGLFDAHVEFGILHLIGFSIAVAYPFLPSMAQPLPVDALLHRRGLHPGDPCRHHWLVWLGLTPARYAPVDFFPSDSVVWRRAAGRLPRQHALPDGGALSLWLTDPVRRPFAYLDFLGRHSLANLPRPPADPLRHTRSARPRWRHLYVSPLPRNQRAPAGSALISVPYKRGWSVARFLTAIRKQNILESVVSPSPTWWNWHTQQVEGLCAIARGGSSPSVGTHIRAHEEAGTGSQFPLRSFYGRPCPPAAHAADSARA